MIVGFCMTSLLETAEAPYIWIHQLVMLRGHIMFGSVFGRQGLLSKSSGDVGSKQKMGTPGNKS